MDSLAQLTSDPVQAANQSMSTTTQMSASSPCSSMNDSAAAPDRELDDDGKPKRSGTVWTATAHIITGVIGSGTLSLPWCMAKLGWMAGIVALITFGAITYFMSLLLADCYRQLPDREVDDDVEEVCGSNPKRNCSYMQAVRSHLGDVETKLCALVQYTNLVGMAIGYTIATSASIVAITRSNCFHAKGRHDASCHGAISYRYMLMYGGIQVVLSQIPNLSSLWWLSIVAAIMSLSYAGIGTGLGISTIISNGRVAGSLTGGGPALDVWSIFQALGDMAIAFAFNLILLDIQDTLKQSSNASESKTMKKANLMGVSTTTLLYALVGCAGYGALGSAVPGNLLTGSGFYEPYWLLDIANACVILHLVGAYQVFIQPFFSFVDASASSLFPHSPFIHRHHRLHIPFFFQFPPSFSINLFRLVWRTCFVLLVTLVAMLLPFFNDVLGVLGAITFWPLTVYFPVAMHLKRSKTPKWSAKWCILQSLSFFSLLVSLVAMIGSVQGLVVNLRTYKPNWKI